MQGGEVQKNQLLDSWQMEKAEQIRRSNAGQNEDQDMRLQAPKFKEQEVFQARDINGSRVVKKGVFRPLLIKNCITID